MAEMILLDGMDGAHGRISSVRFDLPRVLPLLIAMCVATTGALAQPARGQSLAELLQQARALAQTQRIQEAHALLEGAEDEFIGLPEFDYELGRAALAAGHPDRATLALTRVLAIRPNHAGALIDMGRAFLALGNFEQARRLFEAVLGQNPPPEIRAHIGRELRLLPGAGPRRDIAATGFVRFSLGHDDNVNQSANLSQVFIPLFGQSFALDARNVRTRDRFAAIAGGAGLAFVPEFGWGWTAALEILQRKNEHRSEFDLGGIGGRAGVLWRGGEHFVRIQTVTSRSYLDGAASRKFAGLTGEWLIGDRTQNQWLVTTQHGRLRHPGASLSVFDAALATAGLTRIWLRSDGASVATGINVGTERALSAHPSGSRRYLGPSAALRLPIADRWRVEATLAAQRSRYDREDAAFLAIRSDRRVDAELALRWQIAAQWSARAGILWTRQASNVPIYSFERQEFTLSVQKDFQ